MRCLLHIAVCVALALATMACSDDSCYDNGSSLPLASCFIGSTQQTIGGLSVMGLGTPGDSMLLNHATVNEVYLPLRASATTTAFAVWRTLIDGDVITNVTDTITLDYEPIAFFHSRECGMMYNFDIKRVTATSHGIDSVVLLNSLVTNSRTPSLRIYFTSLAQ